MNENNNILDNLIQITEKKRELLVELYDITISQNQELKEKNISRFYNLVEKKSNVIEKINFLDDKFEKLYLIFKNHSKDNIVIEKLKKFKDIINKVQDIILKTQKIEKENNLLIKDINKQINKELKVNNKNIDKYKKYNK